MNINIPEIKVVTYANDSYGSLLLPPRTHVACARRRDSGDYIWLAIDNIFLLDRLTIYWHV